MGSQDLNIVDEHDVAALQNADKVIRGKIQDIIKCMNTRNLVNATERSFDLFITLFRTTLTEYDMNKWQQIMDHMSLILWATPNIVADAVDRMPSINKLGTDFDTTAARKATTSPYRKIEILESQLNTVREQ
jgi:hypothetical protein